jgi:hypothetical protein
MRRFEFDFAKPRHGQGIDNAPALGRDPLIFLDAEEYVSGLPTVRDKDRTRRGGFLGPTGVLIKLPAG